MKLFSDLFVRMIGTACCVAAVTAQVASAQTAEAEEQAPARFDPTPFLTAMVEYRLLAFSCEEVLPGSPLQDSAEIPAFFEVLGQLPPVGSDSSTDRIVFTLVRSQAAAICTKRLRDAGLAYGEQAVRYQTGKPEAWPSAPAISAGPWCQSESCSELRVVRGGALFD